MVLKLSLRPWTPNLSKIMASEAIVGGFGLLLYILLGSRQELGAMYHMIL